MATPFSFEIDTLYRLFFSGEVQMINLAIADGEIGICANHSFFTAPVLSCILRIRDDKGDLRLAFISDGILEVKAKKTVLMVDTAEWPEEIELERAIAAKEKAEKEVKESTLPFQLESAKIKLRRAEYRLKAYELRAV
jgi:F-type H+-transporting ATPase subunit epsilon